MKITLFKKLSASIIFLGLLSHSVHAYEVVSVDKNFASPIISLKDYNKVYIQELDFSEAKIISPPWIDKDSFHWDVKPGNGLLLQESYKEGVIKGLTEKAGRFTIAEKEGTGVLSVDVEIISFMPYALQEDTESTTKGSGEFHLSAHLRDGRTGALVHIFEGTVAIGKEYQPNTDMARLAGANELFYNWGKTLRKKLDEAD